MAIVTGEIDLAKNGFAVRLWMAPAALCSAPQLCSALTKVFCDTHAPFNVRMKNVLPGRIDSLPATDAPRESVPMRRYGKSEEIAATIAFLAS